MLVAGFTGGALVLPEIAAAATTGTEFQQLYTFVNDAATGYLGRALAITGGLFGLGIGAATGRAMLAALGIVLAIFGALGPTIVDAIFGAGAII
ncbi:MAG TPA: conjugal transfer protein TraB [Thiotrichales bacterium]|nr:conjugal transfer protein TraB [Thiotrichales bacterium]